MLSRSMTISACTVSTAELETKLKVKRFERQLRKLEEKAKLAKQDQMKHPRRQFQHCCSDGPDLNVVSDSSEASSQSSPDPEHAALLQERAIEWKLRRREVAAHAKHVATKIKHHLITHCGVQEGQRQRRMQRRVSTSHACTLCLSSLWPAAAASACVR
jgi:hypothetical protein